MKITLYGLDGPTTGTLELVPDEGMPTIPVVHEIDTLAALMELPVGSVILAQFPAGAAEKHPDGRNWWFTGSHITYPPERVPLPAKLLWHPSWSTS